MFTSIVGCHRKVADEYDPIIRKGHHCFSVDFMYYLQPGDVHRLISLACWFSVCRKAKQCLQLAVGPGCCDKEGQGSDVRGHEELFLLQVAQA